MTAALATLNAMPDDEAAAKLRDCCGSTRWIERMLRERPFRSTEHLLTAAETAWRHLAPDDWQEAFAHHPRIGERRPRAAVSAAASAWSAMEQSLAAPAEERVRDELSRAGADYERKFGMIYIVCATGLGADDILADLRRRLGNEPETEQRIAAAEQAKITILRLRKLIGHEP